MSTFSGFGTALRGYTGRRPDGTHHATNWVVAAGFPVIPLRRYQLIADRSTTTNAQSRITVSRQVTVVSDSRPNLVEVLLTYLSWWIIGPVAVAGPLVAVTESESKHIVDSHDAWYPAYFVPSLIWFFFGGLILNAISKRARRLPR